jgi:hypothetical protein
MESLKKLHSRILVEMNKLDLDRLSDHMIRFGFGQLGEVLEFSDRPNGYYKWLHCFMKMKKPKQVVELGAAAGISTVLMATGDSESKIVSIDCDPQAWRWMDKDYPNVIKILGDDLNLDNFIGVNLSATDFWVFDSLHTKEQLRAEIDLFEPFFNKGTILAIDDIHMNPGMEEVWESIPYEKLDVSDRLHWSGFGIVQIK